MLRYLVLVLPPVLVIGEVIFYALDNAGLPFAGIPTAFPPFRDIYILTINAICSKPVFEFYSTGSCSDQFYGVPPGGFDYPILPFLLARVLPSFLFLSPSILAIIFATFFAVAVFMVSLRAPGSTSFYLAYLVFWLSYPVRYMLERGQLDSISWSLCILGCLVIPLTNKSRHKSRKTSIKMLLSQVLILLSAAIKVFTFPMLFLNGIISNHFSKKKAILVASIFSTLCAVLILFPSGLPGKNATRIQIEPGEIHGLLVAVDSHSDLFIKISIIVVTSMLFLSLGKKVNISTELRLNPQLTMSALTAAMGASAFCLLYLFATSANYKLVSVGFFYIGASAFYAHLINPSKIILINTSAITKFKLNRATCAVLHVLCIPVLIFNYRPYDPSLQFLSQDLFDFVWCPAIFGIMLAYTLKYTYELFNASTRES